MQTPAPVRARSVCVLLLSLCVTALDVPSLQAGREMVPAARRIAWHPGVAGGVPVIPVVANVRDFGARGDGLTDDAAAFQAAIASVQGPGAVYVPPATYQLRNTVRIKSGVVLRGAGPTQTHLEINHGGNAIEFSTSQTGTWVAVRDGYLKDSIAITVADASRFVTGGYVEIQQENDAAVMYTQPDWDQPWAQNVVGQIARVAAINGNRLTLDTPLHIDFDARLRPVARPLAPLENAGIENLHLRRLDISDTQMIVLQNVANVWVVRVFSELAAVAHVNVSTGYRVEVRDSDFRDATNYGGGGHGYGVDLNTHTTSALVENNVFRHLRHSMMAHVGASGNVFGYNYSREPQSETAFPTADMSVHGHYPFSNLFEGNIVQGLAISDFWGPAGPHNLFFRNRVETAGIQIGDRSNHQNLVGNELPVGTIARDASVDPLTLIVHGNRVGNAVTWDSRIADTTLPDSYYLDAKPDFFVAMAWPSTGADRAGGTNPAKARYLGSGVSSAPGAPGTPRVSGSANSVLIRWTEPTAGASPGAYSVVVRATCDGPVIGILPVGDVLSTSVNAPNGAYCVSVRAANTSGTGPESAGTSFSVPLAPQPPGAPALNPASVTGSTVTLSWLAGTGAAPASYVVQARLTPGGPIVASLPVSGAAVTVSAQRGTYIVTLVAVNPAGTSPVSNQIAVVVP